MGATRNAVTALPAETPSGLEQLAPVLILLGLKTVVDLALHLWERSRAGSAPAAATG